MPKHALGFYTQQKLAKFLAALAATALSATAVVAITPTVSQASGCDATSTTIPSVSGTAGFGGGTGTSQDPWQICSRAQLAGIDDNATTLEGNYILSLSLDLGGSGSPWTPLTGIFSGKFNGDYLAITNIYITGDRVLYGLFETIGSNGLVENLQLSGTILSNSTATAISDDTKVRAGLLAGRLLQTSGTTPTVQNITVSSATLSGVIHAGGGLVGRAGQGIINQVRVDNLDLTPAAVADRALSYGGILGYGDTTQITRAEVSGQLRSQPTVFNNNGFDRGGIVGNIIRGTVSQSRSNTSFQTDSDGWTGGLVGQLSSNSEIKDSVFIGAIPDDQRTGGATGVDSGTVKTNNLVSATIGASVVGASGRGPWTGGAFGSASTGTFFDMDIYGTSYTVGSTQNLATAQTTANLQTIGTYEAASWSIKPALSAEVTVNWSLSDSSDPIWKIAEGSYPELVWLDFFDNQFVGLSYPQLPRTIYPGESYVVSSQLPNPSPATTYALVNSPAPFTVDPFGDIFSANPSPGTSHILQISGTQASRGLMANVFVTVSVSDGSYPKETSSISQLLGPEPGETIWASAFERYLSPDITTDASLIDEYVYRITTEENEVGTSVDSQPATGYDSLTIQQQDAWYQAMGAQYLFKWRAFVCVTAGANPSFDTPTNLQVSYTSIEDIFTGTNFDLDDNADLRKIHSQIGHAQPANQAVVGYQNTFIRGSWGWDYSNAVVGVSEVTGDCTAPATFEALDIIDSDGNPITAKSLDTETLHVQFASDPPAEIEPAGLTVGVTGSSTTVFQAALWGITTIKAPAATGSAPYLGPVVKSVSDAAAGSTVYVTGQTLGTVTSVEVDGIKISVTDATPNAFSFKLPASVAPGVKDLKVLSSFGFLTAQASLRVLSPNESTQGTRGQWSKLQANGNSVKLYAKAPVNQGKIQFFKDGKEIAWIRATDLSDPKLSFASTTPYLVRTVNLTPGKNRFEIKIDGQRVWFATYVPKN